ALLLLEVLAEALKFAAAAEAFFVLALVVLLSLRLQEDLQEFLAFHQLSHPHLHHVQLSPARRLFPHQLQDSLCQFQVQLMLHLVQRDFLLSSTTLKPLLQQLIRLMSAPQFLFAYFHRGITESSTDFSSSCLIGRPKVKAKRTIASCLAA